MANSALQNLLAHSLVQRVIQSAPAITNVVLVAILGWWASGLVWFLVPVGESPPVPVSSSSYSAQGAPQKIFYGAQIANHQLFGRAEVADTDKKAIENAPDTRLDLVLRGVLAHDPQEQALALISRGRGAQEVYGIGDRLPGNAELVEVYPDRVIIEYQGRYETLRLPETSEVSLGGGVDSSAPLAQKSYQRVASQQAIPASRATQLRREFLDDPARLMKMVNIKQEHKDGELLGYKVSPKGDPSLFYEVGLQDGDIIVSVNGMPLSNTKGLSSLRRAKRYDVVVMRGGAEVPLSISFD